MTRLFLAIPVFLAVGCAAPKATIVEEAPKERQAVKPTTIPTLPGPEIGLRDPDVVSELPADTGMRSPAPVPSGSPDGRPTVIARPPSEGSTATPPASGAN